ncbi:MAG: aldo/keto reductase [Prevotella sp.]|jgi:diketogulonate reductase-like aldo/keto reductase
METKFKLRNGITLPAIGFGTWRATGEEAQLAVKTAIECGYRLIDTAAVYKNENFVGNAIKDCLKRGVVKREELYVTSKVWNTCRGYDKTIAAFKQTLSDLQLDYLDLYLIHWPASPHQYSNWRDINADTWRALETLYKDGLVKSIGVSNFYIHHLDPLMQKATVLPMVDQLEIHPGNEQKENVEWCHKNDIVVEAWRPLGKGALLSHPIVQEVVSHHPGHTAAHVLLRWLLQQDILPLPKSITPERIRQNINCFDFELSDQEIKAISQVEPNGGVEQPDEVDF